MRLASIHPWLVALLSVVPWTVQAAETSSEARFRELRLQLMREIEADALQTAFETGRSSFSPRVMDAMRAVPRHRFVPLTLVGAAYENRPLSIGHGQTISQPYIVALMTDLLAPQPGHRVLEIGTGSGYQAAVLSPLVKQVYTMEIIEPLARQATQRLRQLGYANVATRAGDGYYGWPEHAPYDGIVVTAASNGVPPPLVRQLKPGGRMVIPVGAAFSVQYLMLIEKSTDGTISTRQILPVRFVPLTGGERR